MMKNPVGLSDLWVPEGLPLTETAQAQASFATAQSGGKSQHQIVEPNLIWVRFLQVATSMAILSSALGGATVSVAQTVGDSFREMPKATELAQAYPYHYPSRSGSRYGASPRYGQPPYGEAGAANFSGPSNSSGQSVAELQQRLINLGYYNGAVSGSFDSATEAAVRRFQQDNGLASDGIVGSRTEEALYSQSGQSQSDNAAPGFLQVNNSGNQVTELQRRLTELGYYSGSISGVFDSQTEAAVIGFQRANGLSTDGIVGSATEAALQGTAQPSSTAQTSDAAQTPATVSGFLQSGVTGPEVSDLQTRLQKLGFYEGPITGNYGPQTESAVIAFQQSKGLNADGIAGPQVTSALEVASTSGQTSTSSPAPAQTSSTVPSQSAAVTSTGQAGTSSLPSVPAQAEAPSPTSGQTSTPSVPSVPNVPNPVGTSSPTLGQTSTPSVPGQVGVGPEQAAEAGAQPGNQAVSQAPFGASPVSPSTYQNAGASRYSVLSLQQRLQGHGYDPGQVNGELNSETQNAITQAQRAYGLSGSDLFGGASP